MPHVRPVLLLCFPFLVGASAPEILPLATIPYRPDGTAGKLITLPVSVNGAAPRPFILDTGAPRSVLDARLASELKLHAARTTREGGTGQGTVPAGHPGPISLSVGGVRLPVSDPLTLNLASPQIDRADRGLIGSELLTRCVVRIDPVRHVVLLFDPGRFRPQSGDVVLPLETDVEHRRFYLDAVLQVRPGLTVRERLRIDTGSEDSVDDPIVRRARQVQRTRLGNGIGADYQGYSGVFEAVRVGPFRFTHVWGPGGKLPAIGMELLRRFVVTLDAPHGRLYLRPTSALNEPVPPPS